MHPRKTIPDPIIVPLQSFPRQAEAVGSNQLSEPTELRSLRVEEFLQARSLAPKSQKAYRQDLQSFLHWTDAAWAAVTPRQVAQFKAHLLRQEEGTTQRVLSDATVRRVLGTLKNFYGWLVRSRYVSIDPTTEVALPKLAEPEAQNLTETEVEQIVQAAAVSSLPERNLALIFVLLHGLRAEEVSRLNLADYDGRRLHICEAKADSKGFVPLSPQGKAVLEQYLQWRALTSEELSSACPLFASHSRRNRWQRLGYDGIRKVMAALAKQTGIVFHAHQFRHTFATDLVLKGMNPYHVMTLTRHRSVQNFRRYTKAADQAAAEAAFDAVMGTSSAIASGQDQIVLSTQTAQPELAMTGTASEVVAREAFEKRPTVSASALSVSSSAAAQSATVYQLKVVLEDIRPALWRRFQVLGNTTLAQLHQVLQITMGWEDYHLHRFSLSEDESLCLDQLSLDESCTFSYVYDFGDEWVHQITVEKLTPLQTEQPHLTCLAGKRACPPEDCGGSWGYTALLKTLQNPRHPEYSERKEWIGREFNPEMFNLNEVSKQLEPLANPSSP